MIHRGMIERLLKMARGAGADDADVSANEYEKRIVTVRVHEVERIESFRTSRVTLRMFQGKRAADTSTSDTSRGALDELITRTREKLPFCEEDDACGLPDSREYPLRIKEFNLFDTGVRNCSISDQIEMARQMEHAARGYDPRITNVHASESTTGFGTALYGSSRGFLRKYKASLFANAIEVVAGSGDLMQAGLYYSQRRHRLSLEAPRHIGSAAAMRALRQLGGRSVKTQETPVVFDPWMASGLMGILAQAVSGYSIYRNVSFLCNRLNEMIASPVVTIWDDATLTRGLGSRPFDDEGVSSRRTSVVERGRLKSYLLDTYSSRKLGLKTTGNAGGISNFFLERGRHRPEEIIASVKSGLYVVELMGFGVNLLTGDYSQGARGLWIENGRFAYPVEEITIAGNLNDMLKNIEMVGNDLEFQSSISSPTLKISPMMIAGK